MGIFELVLQVMQTTSGPPGAGPAGAVVGGGFMAFFFGMWCFMLVLGLSGFVLFIIALVAGGPTSPNAFRSATTSLL